MPSFFLHMEELRPFDIISVIFSSFPFIGGCYFRKTLPSYAWPVLILTGFAFLTDATSLFLAIVGKPSNTFMVFYSLAEIFLFAVFYSRIFSNKMFSITSFIFVGSFICIMLWQAFTDHLNLMHSFFNAAEGLILIGLSFGLFIFIIRSDITLNLTREPFFWINTAVLVYFSGNLILFLFMKFLTLQQLGNLWGPIHNSLNIIYNVLLIRAFWQLPKPRTYTSL